MTIMSPAAKLNKLANLISAVEGVFSGATKHTQASVDSIRKSNTIADNQHV